MKADNQLGLFDNSPVCYQSLDVDGNILEVNKLWLTTFGYEKEEVIGRWFGDLIPEVLHTEFKTAFELYKDRGGVSGIFFDVLASDGRLVPVQHNGYSSFDEDKHFIRSNCFLEPAKEGTPTYSHVLDITSVPLIIFNSQTAEIVQVNVAACKFYGYTYEKFVSLKMEDLNVTSADDTGGSIDDVLLSSEDYYIFTHRLADGTLKTVEAHPSRIHFSKGIYICVLLTDITAKVKAEQRLKSVADLSAKLLDPGINMKGISKSVVSYARMLTGASDAYAGSLDEDTQSICLHAFETSAEVPDAYIHGPVEFKIGADGRYAGLWGVSLNTLKPYLVNSVDIRALREKLPGWHVDINNMLSYPVMLDGELVGQIAVANSPAGFTDEDIITLEEIAKLYALAIKSQKERAVEALFRTLFDNVADYVVVCYHDGTGYILKTLNKAARAACGYQKDDVKGKKLLDAFPGMGRSAISASFDHVRDSNIPAYLPLTKYEDADRSLWLESYVFKLQDKYLVAIFRNITDLVRANRSLIDSEAKYRSYIENSPDPIIIIDSNMNIVDFNGTAVEKFEYTPDEMRRMLITDLWLEEETEKYRQDTVGRKNLESFRNIHAHVSKSGRMYMMHVHVRTLPNGCFLGILQDMTARIDMERELNDLNNDLQKRVEKEVAIREKQDRILFEQKKLADMGQMINAIAHQWRQPINALGLYIQSVASSYFSGSISHDEMDDFRRDTLGLIQHMSRTIDDFRGFFQPDKGLSDFVVVKEISSLLKLIETQLGMKKIKLNLTCGNHQEGKECDVRSDKHCCQFRTVVHGYPGEFKQAVINVIYNAADSIQEKMEKGKITSGHINVNVKSDGKFISVEVSDNGMGIPRKVLSKIFDPYFTTKEEGKGTGIGLYMSKMVIEKHMKGRITASTGRDGACFEIRLPISY